jgi:hypothetical protein
MVITSKSSSHAPSSNSCTRASPAQLQQQRVEVRFGLINFNKLDDAISASPISSSSFCKRNELQISQTPLYELTILQRMGLRNKNKRSEMEDVRENLIRLEAKESADSHLACVEENMKYKF